MLAAEIGKSLLENNIAMKNKYEELLNNTRSTSPSNSVLTAQGVAALPTPSSSILTNGRQQGSESGIESYEDQEADDDIYGTMRFVPSQSTREAMIEALEIKNSELNKHLESILEEQATMDKSNTKKHHQLEQEITMLNSSLDMATTKIQELEEMNKRSNGKRRPGNVQHTPSDDNVDRQLIDDLLDQIDQLKTQNDTTVQSKQDLENKLANTLQDLRRLKEQFEQFQFTKDDHEDLKAAYERQFKHIDELNASVEEHRSMLQTLKDRHSRKQSIDHQNGDTLSTTTTGFRDTLLGELENEWMKRQRQQPHLLHSSFSTPNRSTTPTPTHRHSPAPRMKPSLSSTLSLKDLTKFTGQSISAMYNHPQGDLSMESVLAQAAGVDQKTLEDAIRFVDRLEDGLGYSAASSCWDDDQQQWMTMFDPAFPRDGLYPDASTTLTKDSVYPKTFNGRIQNTVRHFFRAVWRWCRFAAILTTAILISLWNGPDYMLLEN